MEQKKKCIAMILAGGQGSRLYALTTGIAKPAVPFGGKYRIIDFALSNCVNSGIDTVGVLTQYQPLELNEYIGNGQPWDLDRLRGGVFILPPYQQMEGTDWYTGTANAILQNLHFINRYDPEYVLILAGDHIYKMDYGKMLDCHIEKQADCTIAVLPVDPDEASRFGIMNTTPDGRIYEFEEKPVHPKSTLASMGIYIFTTSVLCEYLQGAGRPIPPDDFGKDVIPAMLEDHAALYAYSFSGYWKDVGTISSFWRANMDMISPEDSFDINASRWRIYSRNAVRPPHYVGEHAHITHSIVTEGATILGEVENSVLFANVLVEEGAVVRNSILMAGTVVEAGATVDHAILGENCHIPPDVTIGVPQDNEQPDLNIEVVTADATQICVYQKPNREGAV